MDTIGYFERIRLLCEARTKRLGGQPSNRAIAKVVGKVPTTIGDWLAKGVLPKDVPELLRMIQTFRDEATRRGRLDPLLADLLDHDAWKQAYQTEANRRNAKVGDGMRAGQARRALLEGRPGRPIGEYADSPIRLGVHEAIGAGAGETLPGVVPLYVRREHDDRLDEFVGRGDSGVIALVGGSSTGKTRACWEAVRGLGTPWRLWHPLPSTFLDELDDVGPHTVIWLDDAQDYLTEDAAERLRHVLADGTRAPVLVMATLWREQWQFFTEAPDEGEHDAHLHTRKLVAGRGVEVPTAFVASSETELLAAADRDPRLARALAESTSGQLVQYLAGVPALVSRYRHGTPAEQALIEAAVDARRLGVGTDLPVDFLAAAAPGYFNPVDWHATKPDWCEKALATLSRPVLGLFGPLTRPKPRDRPAEAENYRLAPYLEQLLGKEREATLPPAEFWDAAPRHLDGTSLARLALHARLTGFAKTAAHLRKAGVRAGSANGAHSLLRQIAELDPDGARAAAEWLVTNLPMTNAYEVRWLADDLREHDADDLARALYRRAAGETPLSKPDHVTILVEAIHSLDDPEITAALLARDPARQVPLSNERATFDLLRLFHKISADDQVATLARRAARTLTAQHTWLLRELVDIADEDLVGSTAARMLRQYDIHEPAGLIDTLEVLHTTGANDKVAELFRWGFPREAARAEPDELCKVLWYLRELGAEQYIDELIDGIEAPHNAWTAHLHMMAVELRVPADIIDRLPSALRDDAPDLSDTITRQWYFTKAAAAENKARAAETIARQVILLRDHATAESVLQGLWHVDEELTAAVVAHAAKDVDLTAPGVVAVLLEALDSTARHDDIAALLARGPATVAELTEPAEVAALVTALNTYGHRAELARLLGRDPAGQVLLADLDDVASLMTAFESMDAQLTRLGDRLATETDITAPEDVVTLLDLFSARGLTGQRDQLLGRGLASEMNLDTAASRRHTIPNLLRTLHSLGAHDETSALSVRLAAELGFQRRGTVMDIARAMRETGNQEQATALAARAADSGEWSLYERLEPRHAAAFPFGRDTDGVTPTPPWGWSDLP